MKEKMTDRSVSMVFSSEHNALVEKYKKLESKLKTLEEVAEAAENFIRRDRNGTRAELEKAVENLQRLETDK